MSQAPGFHHDQEDGEVWARIYIAALSSPPAGRKVTASELAVYARTVADKYLDFRRASRRAALSLHHSRPDKPREPDRWRGGKSDAPR